MRLLLFLLLALSLLACTAARPKSSTLLEPAAWDLNAQPGVVAVNPEADIANKIEPGDTLISVGAERVDSYSQLIEMVSEVENFDRMLTLQANDGSTVRIPMEDAFPGDDEVSHVTWIQPGATAVTGSFENPDGEEQSSGLMQPGAFSVAVALRKWETTPTLLEVQLAISASQDCDECEFKNLGVLGLAHNSWVQPIPMNKAAWAVYPDLGNPGQMVDVPEPRPAGGTAYSSSYGTVNAYSYGNNIYGTYHGNTTTNYYQRYDYSATNTANMHNLGVAIRNARIENQNKARREFVAVRRGNLELGKFNPGQTMVGHVFYALPAGFDGPFGVEVVSDSGHAAWLRFDASPSNEE